MFHLLGYTSLRNSARNFAKLCEKLCETLREIDNQIFHAESRKGKNAKFRKEV